VFESFSEDRPVDRFVELEKRDDDRPLRFQNTLSLLKIPVTLLVQQMRHDRKEADHIGTFVGFWNTDVIDHLEPPIRSLHDATRKIDEIVNHVEAGICAGQVG